MSLTLADKQTLYRELAQFLRSGITLPQAVETLVPETPNGALRQAYERLREAFRQGSPVADAFAKLRPGIGEMEAALIGAASNAGRLEQAFLYLSPYFESLAAVRSRMIKQMAWPLVQLHLGVLILGIPKLFAGGTLAGYLLQCGLAFAMFYVPGALSVFLAVALLRLGRTSAGIDRLLRRIPLLGTLRRNLALSRLCAVYEMQLQAAINIMDGLRAAASASQSALIRQEIERVIPKVLGGERVSAALTGSTAFPEPFLRVLRIGEDTGSLDADLRQWSEYYRNAALGNLDALGSWIPRVIFVLIAIYIGYVVVSVYSQIYIQPLQQAMDN